MRTEARIRTRVWNDEEFRALDPDAKLLYFTLLSQPTLSLCGVIGLTIKGWANDTGLALARARRALAGLCAGRFTVVDDASEELWVRTLTKNDGVLDQPNLVVAMSRDFCAIRSKAIREGFLEGLPEGFLEGLAEAFPKAWADGLRERLAQDFLEALRVRPRAFPFPLSPNPSSLDPLQGDEALMLIAKRRLARREKELGPVNASGQWLRAVRDGLREEFAAELAAAPEGLTSLALADWVETPLSATAEPRPFCGLCEVGFIFQDDGSVKRCPTCQ